MKNSTKNTERMLCVFTKILGGKTFSEALELVLSDVKTLTCKIISYEHTDYKIYPTPWPLAFSNSIESAWRIRKKVQNELKGWEYESVFFSSYHLLLPFWFVIRKKKTYLSLDTTPSLAIRQSALQSSKRLRMMADIKAHISKVLFRQYFQYIDVFFARSQWCADSLIKEYGIMPAKIVVTYMPVEVPQTTEKFLKNISVSKLSLLFVGNDFGRKGGQFLLDMFREYLSEKCTLTILSSATPSSYNLPDGVIFVNGCGKHTSPSIFDYYNESDLFVFPTWNEQLGLVLCEAISTGLPVIARDVGGIRELVDDGKNGYLQPFNAPAEEWATKILQLAEDKHLLRRFSDSSLKIAQTLLVKKTFEQLIMSKISC